jgi:hypothetical protein
LDFHSAFLTPELNYNVYNPSDKLPTLAIWLPTTKTSIKLSNSLYYPCCDKHKKILTQKSYILSNIKTNSINASSIKVGDISITSLNGYTTHVGGKLNDLTDRLDDYNGRINNLSTSVDTHTSDLADVKDTQAIQKKDIEDLNKGAVSTNTITVGDKGIHLTQTAILQSSGNSNCQISFTNNSMLQIYGGAINRGLFFLNNYTMLQGHGCSIKFTGTGTKDSVMTLSANTIALGTEFPDLKATLRNLLGGGTGEDGVFVVYDYDANARYELTFTNGLLTKIYQVGS